MSPSISARISLIIDNYRNDRCSDFPKLKKRLLRSWFSFVKSCWVNFFHPLW